ncbi:MAG: cadherin repeat domain-containing protein, partial [Candidatus Thioglobus sp.]
MTGTEASLFTIDVDGTVTSLPATVFDFENPTDTGTDNVYNLTITATDSEASTANKQITITITQVTADFTINDASASIPENTAFSATATTAGTTVGDITWSLKAGNDAAKFTIDSATGVITSTVAFDYENPTDTNTDNIYKLTIIGTDTNGAKNQPITVTVGDVIESANFTITGIADSTIAENIIFISVAPTLTGETPIGTITYSLSGADESLFTIDTTTGAITANAAFDHENPTDDGADNIYNLTITATDDDDNTDSANVIITITNVFENTLTIADQTREVAENANNDDLVGIVLETTGEPTEYNVDVTKEV